MEIRYPNYYKNFQCIAGACPDTCCAGWEIPVDVASEKRYRAVRKSGSIKNKEFVRKLKKYIKNGRIISDSVTCPFLNQNGLCEMYIELGPDSLCHTCARHPRHLEDYGNLHEMVLLLSCPEVARLVLEENDGRFFVKEIPNRQGNMDGIDENFLEILLELREQIWNIAKNREISAKHRLAYVLALGHDVQRRIQKKQYAECRELIERYNSANGLERFLIQWEKTCKNASKRTKRKSLPKHDDSLNNETFLTDLQKAFADLEPIYRNWGKLMKENLLTEISLIDEQWMLVFEYYIYSFLLSALYDGDVLSKIKMAVNCTVITSELTIVSQKNPQAICYIIARQIENSSENRQTFEDLMKNKRFGSRRMIDALLRFEKE